MAQFDKRFRIGRPVSLSMSLNRERRYENCQIRYRKSISLWYDQQGSFVLSELYVCFDMKKNLYKISHGDLNSVFFQLNYK